MIGNVLERIEKRLYRRGFIHGDVRRIVSMQLLVTGLALVFGLAVLWFSAWPLYFGVGAAIAACNLWWLARSVEWSMCHDYTRSLALANFLAFLARFTGMGFALFVCIAWLKAPLVPLLAGLATVVAGLTVWGFRRFLKRT